MEGRLKLAEKERQRALKAKEAVPEDGVSQEELAALNAKADANMAALLQEEADQKVSLSCGSIPCTCITCCRDQQRLVCSPLVVMPASPMGSTCAMVFCWSTCVHQMM